MPPNPCSLEGCNKACILGNTLCAKHKNAGNIKTVKEYDAIFCENKMGELALLKQKTKEAEDKVRRAQNRKQQLMREALDSGDALLYVKQYVISRLRKRGTAEKVFADLDLGGCGRMWLCPVFIFSLTLDGNGTLDFAEMQIALKGMGYPMTEVVVLSWCECVASYFCCAGRHAFHYAAM